MKKIAIVSCDKWKNKIKEDLFLKEYLETNGMPTDIISWEDKDIDYKAYEAMILRSVWGYQHNYKEFKNWLLMLNSKNIKLFNSPENILNNIRKDIQFDILKKNDVPFIDTEFLYDIDVAKRKTQDAKDIVIKPIISGSGNNTYIISDRKLNNAVRNFDEISEQYSKILDIDDNGIILQPFLEQINEGEYACIYIDGENSHNMLRFPGIFSLKQKPIFVSDIPNDVRILAEKVAQIEEFKDCLYMRIDIVKSREKVLVMEVELTEPDLLFKYIDDENIRSEKLDLFAKKIIRRILV